MTITDYPARLILALWDYDQAVNESEKQIALQEVYQVCEDFDVMRKNLEEVYSKTRLMQDSPGYIADMNHHQHSAAKFQNSDWLFWYEIPMGEKTKCWVTNRAKTENYKLF